MEKDVNLPVQELLKGQYRKLLFPTTSNKIIKDYI